MTTTLPVISEENKATKTKEPLENKPAQPKTYLIGSFQTMLHTRLAQNLYNGSWRFGKMGLLQFAKMTAVLWKAHTEDDPYAEWYLLKIYQALLEAKTIMNQHEAALEQQLNSKRGFKIQMFTNPTPMEVTVNITLPFIFLAAELLEAIDYVARQLFTLTRLGIMAHGDLSSTVLYREAQKIFALAREWQYTGVNRADIHSNNPKAQRALRLIGKKVPAEVVNKEIKFAFLTKTQLKNEPVEG